MVQSLQLIFIIVNCNIKLPVGLISFCFRRACVLTLPLRSPNRCLCCRKKQCKVYWLLAFPWKGASSAHVLPVNFSELWWNYAEACWKSKGSFAEFCRNFEQKIISILCVLTQKKLKSCVLRGKLFCLSLNLAIISSFSVLKTRTRVDSYLETGYFSARYLKWNLTCVLWTNMLLEIFVAHLMLLYLGHWLAAFSAMASACSLLLK